MILILICSHPSRNPLDSISLLFLSGHTKQNRNGYVDVFPDSGTVVLKPLGASDSPGQVADCRTDWEPHEQVSDLIYWQKDLKSTLESPSKPLLEREKRQGLTNSLRK